MATFVSRLLTLSLGLLPACSSSATVADLLTSSPATHDSNSSPPDAGDAASSSTSVPDGGRARLPDADVRRRRDGESETPAPDGGKGVKTPQARVSGVVYAYGSGGEFVPGARACLSDGSRETCTDSDANGRYELALPLVTADQDTEVFVRIPEQDIGRKTYSAMTTGSLRFRPDGGMSSDAAYLADHFHLQIVPSSLFNAIRVAANLYIDGKVDTSLCNVALTVTDRHKYEAAAVTSDFLADTEHGVADARVVLFSQTASGWQEITDHGPIYMTKPPFTLPWKSDATSNDGGVFFYNLPAGRYLVRAFHDTLSFNEDLVIHCGGDRFVNAGPPHFHVQK